LTYYLPVIRWHYIIPAIWSIPNILNIWIYSKATGKTDGLTGTILLALFINVLILSETFVVSDLYVDYLDGYVSDIWRRAYFGLMEDFEPILAFTGVSNTLGVTYILNSMRNKAAGLMSEERRQQGIDQKILHDIQLGDGDIGILARRYGVTEEKVSNVISSAQEEGLIEEVYEESANKIVSEQYVKQVIRERLLIGSDGQDVEDRMEIGKPPFVEVWKNIKDYSGAIFYTKTGYPFTYTVIDDVVKTSRTNYALYMDQFEKAYALAPVKGPGEYSNMVRGPSYVWAILHDDRIRNKQW
jgi:hypothetical protein